MTLKPFKNPKLLVVDDELDICNFVKAFFEMRGFEVATALNGRDAMSTLIRERPDIVILDVMLRGGKEGLDLLPRMKETLASAKVIMVTGVEDRDIADRALGLGADDYITKPLVLEYLENTVLEKIRHLKSAAA